MPDDKFLEAMIRDLKANRDTYNTKGKLTSFLNRKTANIEQKQQEIEMKKMEIEMKKIEIKMKKIEKIEEIAEPFLKELRKKRET